MNSIKHIKKIILKGLTLISIVMILFGCENNELTFDSEKWKSDKIGHKKLRLKMTKDLIHSKVLIGIKFDSVINLLGNEFYPRESKLSKKVAFTVKESYGFDIDPLYTSHIIIETDKLTESVLSVEFEETEDRRSWIEKMFTE